MSNKKILDNLHDAIHLRYDRRVVLTEIIEKISDEILVVPLYRNNRDLIKEIISFAQEKLHQNEIELTETKEAYRQIKQETEVQDAI